jgi:glucose/arabinose dehydrogenase
VIERWFNSDNNRGKYGRLRDVVEGPDGALYVLTSNRDGRSIPSPGDDRIYRISPSKE